MNDEPEQVAQSGWQVRQEPDDENVPDGHELTQLPPEASLLLVHVRQNVAEPEQVEHDESQAMNTISITYTNNELETQLTGTGDIILGRNKSTGRTAI